MSELAFIADVIKGLKEEYPIRIKIGHVNNVVKDFETGTQSETVSELTVRKAIKLPENQTLAFLQSIGAGVKAMELLATTVQILLDLDDVSGYNLKAVDSYVIINNKRHPVLSAEVYEYAAVLYVRRV